MKDNLIIKEYVEGKSISQLLRDYPEYNRRQINKILLANNITIRGGRKKKTLTEDEINTLKIMLDDGAFLKEISLYFQLDPETMKKILKELNLNIKNHNRINRHIKSNYFSDIDSPIKAYWLGLLFTDGSVDKAHSTGRIRLQLQEKDLEILEKFKEDLSIDSKIIYDKRSNSICCSVEFVDNQIFNDLAKYGIIPKKTYLTEHLPIAQIPKQYLNSFALGLFDGDGNLYCDNSYSKDVTFGYTAYFESEVLEFKNLINKLANLNSDNKVFFTSAWHTNWRGRLQVIKILDILYQDCPRFLKRKYNIYVALKNSLNQDIV